MSASATLTIFGTKAGLPSGTETIGPLTIANNASADAVTDLNLSPGNNTITVPSGASFVAAVIIPPAGNTVGIKLLGSATDTGINLHPSNPTVLSLAAGVLSFILSCTANVNGLVVQWL